MMQTLRRVLPLVLGVGLFALGLYALYNLLRPVDAAEVWAQIRATHPAVLAGALLSTAVGYVALIGYDWFALRFIDRPLPARAVALGGFLGYAFGNTIGISVISGGAVRYRIYSALGLDAFEVATVSSYIAIALGTGMTLIGLGALSLHPYAVSAYLPFPVTSIRIIAGVLAVGGVLLIGLLSWSGRSLRVWRLDLRLPPPASLAGQMVVTMIDVVAAALALWLLLPAGKPDFTAFIAIYAAAMMIGVLSHVPGGVGVFETVVIGTLPASVPVGESAAALLMFRMIYYLLPFALAFLVVSFNEARMAGGAMSRLFGRVSTPLRPAMDALQGLAPSLVAAVAFGFGVYLLLVSLIPSVRSQALADGDLTATILLEGGTLASAVGGVVLLILSHGLVRRVEAAFWLTLVTLLGGALASLLNGFDYESAGLLSLGALSLLPFRRSFHRQATLTEGVFSAPWFAMVLAVVLASGAFFFFLHRATPYSYGLWFEFARAANTPRALRAGLAASSVLLIFSVMLALRPVRPRPGATTDRDGELARVSAIVDAAQVPQGCLALTGDKRFLFSEAEDAFVMYGIHRATWVALGDPVAPEGVDVDELCWSFLERAESANSRPVFYEVGTQNLPLWLEMGLALHKVGEEAVVHLPEFSLSGARFKSMRAAHNKRHREGLEMEILHPPHSDAFLADLAEVSQEWLGGKAGREKGFSVGRFDAEYLNHFPISVVRCGGEVLAFANILAPGEGTRVAIDLMRYRPEAASGMMEFLFLSLIEHYRDAGAQEFSLGVAPLAGLAERPVARLWNRFGHLIFRHGGAFYNFAGLRAFKQKFQPEWRPRYIAVPPGLSPMLAMADVALLISGGARGLLGKKS